jgi:hypothetical protein
MDHRTIMKITGEKTMEVFQRYNAFDEDGLRKAATLQHQFSTIDFITRPRCS